MPVTSALLDIDDSREVRRPVLADHVRYILWHRRDAAAEPARLLSPAALEVAERRVTASAASVIRCQALGA